MAKNKRHGRDNEAIQLALKGMYRLNGFGPFNMPMSLRRTLNGHRDRLALIETCGQRYGWAWHRQLADLEMSIDMYAEALQDKNTGASDDADVFRKGREAAALFVVAHDGLTRLTRFEESRSTAQPTFETPKIHGFD